MTDANPEPYDRLVEDLLEQINRGRRFEDLFAAVYDRLHGVIPYDRIAVALLDDASDELRLVACRSDGPEVLKVGFSAPVAGSTLHDLLRTGRPRILNDLPAYLAAKPASRSTRLIVREGMRSNLTLPLLADGRPLGVVFFSSRELGAYTDDHARLLRRLAGHLAVSVEKARLLDALHERNRELSAANVLQERFVRELRAEVARHTAELRETAGRHRLLVRLGQIVNASLELKDVFAGAAEELRRLVGCDRVSLVRVEATAGTRRGFALEWPDGGGPRWRDLPPQPVADSAAGWVLEQRRPRVARRLEQARPFVEDRRLYEQGYGAYVYLPLVGRGQPVGVLGLAARQAQRIDGWDLPLLGEAGEVLALALSNAAAYARVAELTARLEQENGELRSAIRSARAGSAAVGDCPAWRAVERAIGQVAPTDSTVLLAGETGTGKELVARAIHDQGPRRQHLLVNVNCAALAPDLVPSELFGHEPGAFTGAVKRRIGRFELARQGTLFLDEVAELSPETQVLLLRVLQERVIERVGGNDPIAVDVRLIAASNRDLAAEVAAGRFRADLFYRLNVFPLRVPPLRERREDIPALVRHFMEKFGGRMGRPVARIEPGSLDLLTAYHWPGNVRELEHLIERAVIVATGDTLQIDPNWLAGPAGEASVPAGWAARERQAITDALRRSGGKVYGPGGAAAQLGLKPTTLYGKMRKHGLRSRDALP